MTIRTSCWTWSATITAVVRFRSGGSWINHLQTSSTSELERRQRGRERLDCSFMSSMIKLVLPVWASSLAMGKISLTYNNINIFCIFRPRGRSYLSTVTSLFLSQDYGSVCLCGAGHRQVCARVLQRDLTLYHVWGATLCGSHPQTLHRHLPGARDWRTGAGGRSVRQTHIPLPLAWDYD